MGIKERRSQEKQIRKDQILGGARDLLFSHGIDHISISKIAKKAELGVGTIYFYYAGKDEIFVALQEEGISLLFSMIQKIILQDISHQEKLKAIAVAYYDFARDQKNYFDIINYFLSASKVFFDEKLKMRIDMSGSRILSLIQDVVQEGINNNIFIEDDPKKFSFMFWGMIHGMVQFKKFENTLLENQNHQDLYLYSVDKVIQTIKR